MIAVAQVFVIVVSPAARVRGTVLSLDFQMHQHAVAGLFLGPQRRRRLAAADPGHQVGVETLPGRRVGQQFLVEPVHAAEVQGRRPGREEQLKQFSQELLQQGLETLIVFGHVRSSGCHDFAQ